MFESLGEKFEGVFKKLRGHGVISEKNVRDAMREVKLALLEADVNFKVVKEFTKRVSEKALGEDVLKSVTPGQQFIKIVHDELVEIMGGKGQALELHQGKLNVILLLGLQGSGKTTFAGKLGKRYAKKGFQPMLVACDVYRPAAIRQLHVVGTQANLPVFDLGDKKKPVDIATKAISQATKEAKDLVIIDTAGRLHIDEVRMDELNELKRGVKPQYTFLVADAMTGQDAVNSASTFNEQVGIDAVCLTKLDGDARGGAALSIKLVTSKPIQFAGVGEKLDDLEEFHPDRMASRILGMGDVVTLVEKAQSVMDEKQAEDLRRKIRKQSLTLQDFLDQMRQVRKMGPLKDLMKMIPGIGSQIKDIEFDEKEISRSEAIVLSMTPYERENPHLIDSSRRSRIAEGSGTSIQQINQFLKAFNESQKMMKGFMGGLGKKSVHKHKKKKKKKR